jgi:hypothetical protein
MKNNEVPEGESDNPKGDPDDETSGEDATTYSDRDWVHLLSARCAGWTGWPASSRSFSVTILVRDVTTRGLGLLESVVGSEGGHHVGMCGNEDPKTDPWDLQSGIYEGDGFHPRHLLPDDRTGVSVPPVLRFSSRRKRQPLLQSSPPYPARQTLVEWLASAPSLRLTPPPGRIAAGQFALPSPGRKSTAGRS